MKFYNSIKKLILVFSFLFFAGSISYSQITFEGCAAEMYDGGGVVTFVNILNGSTNDGGTIRNTYVSMPIDGTQLCFCFAGGTGTGDTRVIWDLVDNRWEIDMSDDGFTWNTIYYNTNASYPDPPSLTLGTWVENVAATSGNCGGNATIGLLTGDVQNTTLPCIPSSIISATVISSNVCPNTSIDITANGAFAGTGATLTWFDGAGGTGNNLGTTNPLNVTTSASTSTTYYARLDGTCGTVESSVAVNVSSEVFVNTTGFNNPSCSGGLDGAISIAYNGGLSPYAVNWGSAVNGETSGVYTKMGLNATTLGTTYTVTIFDANNCSASVSETLYNPSIINLTGFSVSNPSCNGGSDGTITITASGGTGALSYSSDNGISFQTSSTLGGLGANLIDIVVEDVNGCQTSTNYPLSDPSMLVLSSATGVNPVCNNGTGSITVSVSGGTGGYTYSSDNGVTFQGSNVISGIGDGSYSVVVEDATGCQKSTNVILTEPTAVTITNVSAISPNCNNGTNGSISITASGGTGSLSYSIDNGVTFQASSSFPGLSAASYDIVVEDASGCQATSNTVLINPTLVSIDNVVTAEPACYGALTASIVLTASGGTGALSYSIDNGTSFQLASTFNGIGSASYNIVV
ncbi:MAG: SprB repeat-containing protein, partial [Flavobacteriales bacterium]|nr:SprB repeat-containing protein [Flavobacteriales bacterium]